MDGVFKVSAQVPVYDRAGRLVGFEFRLRDATAAERATAAARPVLAVAKRARHSGPLAEDPETVDATADGGGLRCIA